MLAAPAAASAQNLVGSYRGDIHSYCPTFDYHNEVIITVGSDNSVAVQQTDGGSSYSSSGTIAADGAISGLNIRVNSLSRGNLTIPYSAKVAVDGSVTGNGSSGDIVVDLVASRMATTLFTGEIALGGGAYFLQFPNGNYFGYYSYLSDPKYIYHFDLGYEYIFDAADGQGGVYFYDFKSNGFFYTSPLFSFPYLYDFSLNSVVYYYPDPNRPGRYNTNGVRYFYVTSTGQTVSK